MSSCVTTKFTLYGIVIRPMVTCYVNKTRAYTNSDNYKLCYVMNVRCWHPLSWTHINTLKHETGNAQTSVQGTINKKSSSLCEWVGFGQCVPMCGVGLLFTQCVSCIYFVLGGGVLVGEHRMWVGLVFGHCLCDIVMVYNACWWV